MALTKISGEVLQQPINIGVITATSATFDSNVSIGAGATTAFFEVDTGNVGIGTDDPFYKFEVRGDTNTEIRIGNFDDSEAGILLSNTGSTNRRIVASGGDMIFRGGASTSDEHVRVTQGGLVGIGSTQPTAILEVATDVAGVSTVARFKNTSGGGIDQTVDIELGLENAVASNVILRAGKEANHSSGAATDNFFAIHTTLDATSSEKLRITSNGRVGIGTEDPKMALHVYHPAENNVAFFESGDSFGVINLADSNGSVSLLTTLGHLRINTGGDGATPGTNTSAAMMIQSDGDVGIGTENPQAKLHVSGGNIKVDDGFGIDFSATDNSSGTMTSELLDDYEEGTFTMTMSCGGNTANQECRYTKIGRIVYIDGHGDQVTDNYFNTGNNGADAAVTITTNLPFTPVRTGSAPITVSRTLKGANGFDYERMYVGWRKDSATIYLGSENNNYMPVDNVVTNNNQTNKTILFSGHFVTEV